MGTKNFLSELDVVLRECAEKDVFHFSNAILSFFTEKLDAAKGLFYILDESENFTATSGFACNIHNLAKKQFELGEGVIGESARLQRYFYYPNLHDNSFSIETSYGKIDAYAMLALPFVFNHKTLGVLELLFFNDDIEEYLPFLEVASSNAATIFSSVILVAHTRKLLLLSQEQSDRLRVKEEELEESLSLLQKAKEITETNMQDTLRIKSELNARVNLLNKTALVTESDIYGNIIYANEKFIEISKYSMEECLGKPHNLVRHPETPKSIFEEMWRTIKSGNIYRNKYKNLAKDGSSYWVDASISPVIGDNGQILKYIGIRFDITEMVNQQGYITDLLNNSEQQKANLISQEEELRQNLEEIMAIQNDLESQIIETENIKNELITRVDVLNSTALVTESDLLGNITYANPKFCEVSEFTLAECLGKAHKILRHPETPSSLFKEMWETIKSGNIFRGRYRNLSKNGKTYWVDAVIAPVLNSDGKPIKYIGIRYDISQMMLQQEKNEKLLSISAKQAAQLQSNEVELRKNIEDLVFYQKEMQKQNRENSIVKQELQARVDLLNISALVSQTDIYGTIIFANDRFCKVAQYSREELIGQPHNIIRHPDTPKEVFKQMWSTIQSGNIFKGTIKNLAKDGSAYWVDVTVSPITDETGKIVSYLAVRFDITDKILAEIAFKEREAELLDKIKQLENKYLLK